MIQQFKKILTAAMIVLGLSLVAAPLPVGAVTVQGECTDANQDTVVCKGGTEDARSLIKTIVNLLLFIVGAVSVIAIIIGGILYALSAGDSTNVTRAKNTVTYAVVGLIVALLAYAIVNFVAGIF